MKPSLDSCLFTLLLAACLALMPAALRADTSQPLFGGHSLDIHGSTYTWESASEDGAWHYDFYTGDGGTVTVTGMIGFPNLASVSGGGGIDGHLNHGSYADNAQSWSDEGDFEVNGHWFTHCSGSAEYYPDLAGGQLLSSGS